MNLTPSQSAAIRYIEEYARGLRTRGQDELANVLAMSNIDKPVYEEALQLVKDFGRIGLQFHPDRISKSGNTVIQGLIADGTYKNQFESYVSNGRLDPVANGVRYTWEDEVFGGAFSAHGAPLSERPKYGALDLMLHPDGPCPRYGSCYLVLNSEVCRRSTFTYMDSHTNPAEKGTLDVFEPVFAALMTECFEREFALGTHSISPPELIRHILKRIKKQVESPSGKAPARNLNHYIEAQVHGEVSIRDDAEVLVADPSFRGTWVEDDFNRLCDQYKVDLRWHSGFRLRAENVPDDFRGPAMPSLAERVSKDGYVDAFSIGQGAADLMINPFDWSDRGPYNTVLQELKCLWHVVVKFGEPVEPGSGAFGHAEKM